MPTDCPSLAAPSTAPQYRHLRSQTFSIRRTGTFECAPVGHHCGTGQCRFRYIVELETDGLGPEGFVIDQLVLRDAVSTLQPEDHGLSCELHAGRVVSIALGLVPLSLVALAAVAQVCVDDGTQECVARATCRWVNPGHHSNMSL